MLKFDELSHMLQAHVEGSAYAMNTLWMLITLRLWAQEFDVDFDS